MDIEMKQESKRRLSVFLNEVGAYKIAVAYQPDPADGLVELYGASGKTFLIRKYGDGGWDIFVEAARPAASVEETFKAVRAYLGGGGR